MFFIIYFEFINFVVLEISKGKTNHFQINMNKAESD